MADEFKIKVNTIAEKAFELKTSDKKDEYSKLYYKLVDLFLKNAPQNTPSGLDIKEYAAFVGELVVECWNKWEPVKYGFYEYFTGILKLRRNDLFSSKLDPFEQSVKRKMKRELRKNDLTEEEKANLKPEFVKDDSYNAPDEDDNVKELSGNHNTENEALQADIIKKHFDVLNKAIMMQKKKYENSTKPCYAAYFYTEFVTRRIEEENNKSVFNKAESGLMKVIDHDFVSYYMIGDNSSVAGISQGELKKVSAFTEDPSDDRPCGYDIKNIVYAKYISALKKCDKVQSDSSISQQRTKFENLIKLEMRQSFDND